MTNTIRSFKGHLWLNLLRRDELIPDKKHQRGTSAFLWSSRPHGTDPWRLQRSDSWMFCSSSSCVRPVGTPDERESERWAREHYSEQRRLWRIRSDLLAVFSLQVHEVRGIEAAVHALLIPRDAALDGDPPQSRTENKLLQIIHLHGAALGRRRTRRETLLTTETHTFSPQTHMNQWWKQIRIILTGSLRNWGKFTTFPYPSLTSRV